MNRNMSKSLHHVGKLNEGYLSDVHTSFSNIQYESDASSDLVESSRAIERQFKDKYRVLRGAFERRIEQLTSSVESVCARLMSDELIASMKTDAASSVFIPAHISETLSSYLQGDRESAIQDLLEQESSLKIQLKRKDAIIDNQNARLAELEEGSTRGRASEGELRELQEKVKTLESQYSTYSATAKDEIDELRRLLENEKNLKKSLQEQLDKSQAQLSGKQIELERVKADNGIKQREVYELEKSIQLTGRDMTYLSETESRQKIELDECNQKLKRLTDQRDSLASDVNRLTEKLRYSAEDLEKAHAAQELLLREKNKAQQSLDDAITKTKRSMSDEVEQAKEELKLAHKKMKSMSEKFDLDLDREKHATQTYKDEAAISKAIIEEKQKEIKNMANEAVNAREIIDSLHEKLTNVREVLEETNVQLMRTKNTSKEWQSRAYEAENRVHELQFEHKKEKKIMEEQIHLDMEKQLEAERKQLESKSDVFRMHYQNQLLDLDISRTNMSLSRSMAAPPHVDARHSGIFDHDHGHSYHRDSSHVDRSRDYLVQNQSHNSHSRYSDNEVHQLKYEHQKLQKQYEQQLQETDALQRQLHELESNQRNDSQGLSNMESRLQTLKSDYENLREKYDQKRQESTSLQLKLQQYLDSDNSHNRVTDSKHDSQLHFNNLQAKYKRQSQELQSLNQRLDTNNSGVNSDNLISNDHFEKQMQIMKNDYEDLQEQYELKRQEARSFQLQLQKAADTIEVMKVKISDAGIYTNELKEKNRQLLNRISELERECEKIRENTQPLLATATSPISDIEAQAVGISRVRKVEAENEKLRKALEQAKEQAREDHEQDSVLLESMQQKVESLVAKYDKSRKELDESLHIKDHELEGQEEEIKSLKGAITAHEETILGLQEQVKEMVDFNRQLEITHSEEIESLRKESNHHKDDLNDANDKVAKQEETLRKLKYDLDKIGKDAIESDNLEIRTLKAQNRKLNDVVFKIESSYRVQIRELRTALGKVKDNVVVLERSVESEVETITHKTEAFTRPLFDSIAKKYSDQMQEERKRLATAHMKEEKHLINSLKKKMSKDNAEGDENDSASVNSSRSHDTTNSLTNVNQVVVHYKLILQNIFEALSASSILSSGSARDIMFYLDSCNIRNISEQQIGERNSNSIGVVSAKLNEMLSKELNKYVKQKEHIAAQVELMSDMLRKEKLNTAELKLSIRHGKTSQTVSSNQSISNDASSSTVVELESQIRKLESYVDELKIRHKTDIERFKLEWEQEESQRLKTLEVQIQEGEDLRLELENKLRTEQTRRHHLQSRLVSEEAEHRSEMEDFEKRFFDLQKRFTISQGKAGGS